MIEILVMLAGLTKSVDKMTNPEHYKEIEKLKKDAYNRMTPEQKQNYAITRAYIK